MRRKFGVLFSVLLLAGSVQSQSKYGEDSVNCVTNLSLYREYYKQKNYDDAIKPWRWVYNNCPSSSGNIYKNGPTLFKDLMKKNPENKNAYIDTMMMIYDKRIQYFGKQGFVLGRKGADLIKYKPSSFELAHSILSKSLELQGNNSDAGALAAYFKATTLMEGNKKLDKQAVLESYAKVAEIIDYNLVNNPKKEKYYTQASEIIESLFAPYANCEDLIGIFSTKFKNTTEDIDLLKRITRLLAIKECIENQLYFDAATRLHELSPSAISASNMGKLNITKKKYSQAIDYFKQAVELEQEGKTKAKYYLELADAYRISGTYSTARSMAYKSVELRPDWGEPYISIANIYASSVKKCGSTDFEKATIYWLVVDKFIKAKTVDSSITAKANKSIATYSKFFPNTEQCFFQGIESGQTYKVECWINENTKVRTSD
ncbi:MAG: tetratricopeptide repeat protein [Flavobacteriales bacterium]|nr:tetratricopeptide repeat protein [Flavobacteriales bacterium]